MKIYYTIRELTTHLPELWALRSLGDEVLADGPGGGFPWLREHLATGYTTDRKSTRLNSSRYLAG